MAERLPDFSCPSRECPHNLDGTCFLVAHIDFQISQGNCNGIIEENECIEMSDKSAGKLIANTKNRAKSDCKNPDCFDDLMQSAEEKI